MIEVNCQDCGTAITRKREHGRFPKRCVPCKKAHRAAFDRDRYANNHTYRAKHTERSKVWSKANSERRNANQAEWRRRTNYWQRRCKPLRMAKEEERETGIPADIVLKVWGIKNGGLIGKSNTRMGRQD